ncbi:MAG TPA: hypothetical protein VI094_22845 [Propionibacteriaceae bacterium]
MTIVVGYTPTPAGRAALVAAAGVAAERNRPHLDGCPVPGSRR